jgi:acyl transferase domain-containing protein/phospholipid N-methyltransferase
MEKESDVTMEPIAITGIGCRFPGGATGPVSFWKLLLEGVDAIGEVPAQRWDIDDYYHPSRDLPGKMCSRWGGFLDQVDSFDAEFFGISPREAARLSPQQRLMLELAWEALEDAGLAPERLAGSRTGVFVGVSTDEYGDLQFKDQQSINAYTNIGSSMGITANRISYYFDFRGPSLVIDTACSSSLVAAHFACQSLWQGESDLVLLGGVNLLLGPERSIGFSQASMLSPRGRCRAFDAEGDGYVRSEGGGIVVLKPLARALADGDPIYAVIRGTGCNQDGRTTGLSLPSQEAQEALLRLVYARAGIHPGQVQYVEAHGTGTPAGDPIECNALGRVLGAERSNGDYCLIGSVKTNIGHLEAGSGIAGLIKLALALKHGTIPPSLHFQTPNPRIDFEGLHLQVQAAAGPWPRYQGAIAGINSFGFGGSNAHAVLQQYQLPSQANVTPPPERPYLLPISVRSPKALEILARAYWAHLMQDPGLSLRDLCYSAGLRRAHHDQRMTVVARSNEDLIQRLASYLAGERGRGVSTGQVALNQRPKVAFVFSGNGPQWWGMGRQLLEQEPVFRAAVEECNRLLKPYAPWSLLEELQKDEAHSRMDQTAIAQPALFAIQVGLLALWRSWGIEPEAVAGHSVGEVAAIYAAGILSLKDAIHVIFHRSRAQERTAGTGKMAAIELGFDQAADAIAGYGGRLAIAAINAPTSVTVSGDTEALQDLLKTLEAKEIYCRLLRLNYAFHSHLMDPIRDDLLRSLQGIGPRSGSIPFVSAVTGAAIEAGACGADYWWDNIRKPVLFSRAMELLLDQGCNVLLEIGPHPVLASYLTETARQRNQAATVLPSLRRNEDEQAMLLGSVGALYTLGYPLDWNRFFPEGGQAISLPAYPWQRERYWNEPKDQSHLHGKLVHPLLGRRVESADPQWQSQLDTRLLPYLLDHRLEQAAVFPATGYLEMGLAAAREIHGEGPSTLERITIHESLVLDEGQTPGLHLIVSPDANFVIYSQAKPGDPDYRKQFSAKMSRNPRSEPPFQVSLPEIRKRCVRELDQQEFYRLCARRSLHYGPAFQAVGRVWLGEAEILAEIRIPASLEVGAGDYLIHPVLLDAVLQILMPILPGTGEVAERTCWIPVSAERLRFWARPGPRVFAHLRQVKTGAGWLAADAVAWNLDGTVVVDLEGSRFKALDFAGAVGKHGEDEWLYEFRAQSKPLSTAEGTVRSAAFLPEPAALARMLHLQRTERNGRLSPESVMGKVRAEMLGLVCAYAQAAFQRLYGNSEVGPWSSVSSLMKQLGIQDRFKPLVELILRWFEEEGLLNNHAQDWQDQHRKEPSDPDRWWKEVAGGYPAFHAEWLLLGRCGPNLAEILTGALDPAQVLFPEKSTTLEHLYDGSPSARQANRLLQEAISQIRARLPVGRALRILEIGGGTGGATIQVLGRLPKERLAYVFTDLSPVALAAAEERFRKYPFMEFRRLDIEQNVTEQGFAAHSFDLIIAANLVSETTDRLGALQGVRSLLASEGLLVLMDYTQPLPAVELALGLLRRPISVTAEEPASSMWPAAGQWINLLKDAGFTQTAALTDAQEEAESMQALILARGPALEAGGASSSTEQPSTGTWLVFADQQGLGRELAKCLRSRKQRTILVEKGAAFRRLDTTHFVLNAKCSEDMEALVQSIQAEGITLAGIVHGWSLDASSPQEPTPSALCSAQEVSSLSVLNLVQALGKVYTQSTPRLWLVTRQAQVIAPGDRVAIEQAPLWGLGRVIMSEYPDLRCTLVDVGAPSSSNGFCPEDIQALVDELFANEHEEEIILRGGTRFVNRVVSAPAVQAGHARTRTQLLPTESFCLKILAPGVLDNLTLRAAPRVAPQAGDVEIEIIAAGLNFKDVLQALGVIAGEALEQGYMGRLALGMECAGRVVRVGPDVEAFHIGDEVLAFARDAFGGYVTCPAHLVAPKPAGLTIEEAATIPIAFLTAYYALHHVGRLRPGDKVLIHGGAGGVGLAAIQIVQQAGGEVFATAGSPEKREFLHALGVTHVLDSRSLLFADDIRAATKGAGVDIVLNSLAGEAIAKSLEVLRPFGRFLEIGKRDLLQNSRLGLRPFEKCLSFNAIDIDQLLLHDPVLSRSLFRELLEQFESGALHPLPFRVFPIHRAVEAFRHLQQSRHIGKVVISLEDPEITIEMPMPEAVQFKADASYLITGGLSGLGLATAQWMVQEGARHLVLVGRSGASTPEAKAAVEALAQAGARVMVRKVDVTQAEQVASLLAEMGNSFPPLRGVFHSVLVVDDGILANVNPERFHRVVDPKMIGAWNLHLQTKDLPLDYFVLFSSFSSVLGIAGQGSYAAANAFLDMLVHYRRALGLPALTVNWGPVADVGWLARHAHVNDRLFRQGADALTADVALEVLGRLLPSGRTQVAVVDFEEQGPQFATSDTIPARFRDLLHPQDQSRTSEGAKDFSAALQVAPLSERKQLVESRLCAHLASVLGTSVAKIDTSKPITSLGLDSLMAVELQVRVQRDLGVTVPVMNLLQRQTVADLAGYVLERLTTGSSEAEPAAAPQPAFISEAKEVVAATRDVAGAVDHGTHR